MNHRKKRTLYALVGLAVLLLVLGRSLSGSGVLLSGSLFYVVFLSLPTVAMILVAHLLAGRKRNNPYEGRPDPLSSAFGPEKESPPAGAPIPASPLPESPAATENLWDEGNWVVEKQALLKDPQEIQRLLRKGRVRALIPIVFGATLLTAVFAAALWVLYVYLRLRVSPIWFLLIYLFLMWAVLRIRRKSAFNDDYKQLVVREELIKHFQDVYYEPKRRIPEHYFRHLIPYGNVYRSGDYIQGRYRGVAFQQADARLEEETEKGDERVGSIYFWGRSIVMQSPQPVQGELYIWDNRLRHTCIGSAKRYGFTPVQTPDPDFNKRFTVYTTNLQGAQAFLTPRRIGQIKGLGGLPGGGPCAIKCAGNGLHLCIHNKKDAFEANPLRAVSLHRMQEDVRRDLAPLTGAIELLHGV